ncbi:MAG: STAS domain-containing protein [Spirochaetes bacterium]|nr:STAS domain-containing protein [Spirochaetota bacterium]
MMRKNELSPREIEIVLEGHLAREDMSEFQRLLDDALRGGYETIALDLQHCESLDSWAVGKILKFRQRCELSGRRLVIRRCSPRIRELLMMIRFDALIRFED